MSPGTPEQPRHRSGVATAVVAAVILLGSAGVLVWAFTSSAAGAPLIQRDIVSYGSVTEAHRWVLPLDRSAHVQGEAIDVGPAAGAAWLATNGARFGLCRTYANEAWRFEPVIAPGGTCPAPPHPDSSWGW